MDESMKRIGMESGRFIADNISEERTEVVISRGWSWKVIGEFLEARREWRRIILLKDRKLARGEGVEKWEGLGKL